MPERTEKLPGLRRARIDKGLTQAQLAEASGVHRDTLVRLESGRQGAFPLTVARLAAALDVKPRELTTEPAEDEQGGRAA